MFVACMVSVHQDLWLILCGSGKTQKQTTCLAGLRLHQD